MLLLGLVSRKDSKQDATEHRAEGSETPAQSNASSPSTVSELLSPTQLEKVGAQIASGSKIHVEPGTLEPDMMETIHQMMRSAKAQELRKDSPRVP